MEQAHTATIGSASAGSPGYPVTSWLDNRLSCAMMESNRTNLENKQLIWVLNWLPAKGVGIVFVAAAGRPSADG
jgi:hypothetical protein